MAARFLSLFLLLLSIFSCPHLTVSTTLHSLNTTISFTDGDILVSPGEIFEVGFFSLPASSSRRYFGVWYKSSNDTYPWVANRDRPLNDTSGVVQVTEQGILVLQDGNGTTIWSSSNASSSSPVRSPVLHILDIGNLVLQEEGETENFIWQSFDYPGDTFMAGMKIGRDFRTGIDRYLTSWTSPNDPTSGKFTYKLEPIGYPEIIISHNSTVTFRSGPFNGEHFSGMPEMNDNPMYIYTYEFNETELYITYVSRNSSVLLRGVLNTETGDIEPHMMMDPSHGWIENLPLYRGNCDNYGLCGANGICDNNQSPVCNCMTGFQPNNPQQWGAMPGINF